MKIVTVCLTLADVAIFFSSHTHTPTPPAPNTRPPPNQQKKKKKNSDLLFAFYWQEAIKQTYQRALKAATDFGYQKESPE